MGAGTEYDFAVTQYNSDGTIDANFGTNGMVTTPIGTGDNQGFGMALQSDGKIIVAGYAYIDLPLDLIRILQSFATIPPAHRIIHSGQTA
jgi:hypothetical protein